MNQLYERLEILIEQKRYNDAAEILETLLAQHPSSSDLHYKMCVVADSLNQTERALEHCNIAIGLNPEAAYYYYVKASILIQLDEYDEAEENLQTSVEIDPHFSDAFAYWAGVKLERKQFEKALELANESLELDSSNILGLNVRSKAQLKLNDLQGAKETIEDALQSEPNNAYTHTNFGWNLLEEGKPKEALEHFKEALSIEPNFQYAHAGMIEALKAKSYIYRKFLQFSFWMGNKGASFQWGFIIAYYILNRIISSIVQTQPELAVVLNPILYLLIGFALFTWFVQPISNLILRLNSFGRYVLSPNQIANSNVVGILFLVSLLSFMTNAFTDYNGFFALGATALGLAIPFGKWFGEKVKILKGISIGLAILGGASVYFAFITNTSFNQLGTFFIYGLLGYQIVLNKHHIDLDNR